MSTLLLEQNVDTLNSLLRAELSAVESYEDALARFESEPIADDLRRIAAEHWGAVNTLRDHVIGYGGEPSYGSGPWGYFTAVITGAANLIGPETMLLALQRGEEHGISLYEDAACEPDLVDDCRILIAGRLLPQTRTHVQTLHRLLRHLE